MAVVSASGLRTLGSPQTFEVKAVPNLPAGSDPAAVAAFQQRTAEAARRQAAAAAELGRIGDQLRRMRATLLETPRADPALYARLDEVRSRLAGLELRLQGDPARQRLSEPDSPSIGERIGGIIYGHWRTRQMPTATQKRDLEVGEAGLAELERELKSLVDGDLARLEEAFAAAGAPWSGARRLPE
jgi:hypothetical protein